MTKEENEERFAEYLDQYVSYLAGEASHPDANEFGPQDQDVLFRMARVIEANWVAEIELPPFEEDPVALALGLVPPPSSDSAVIVAGDRVRALRQALKLSRSGLVAATSAEGWPVTVSEMSVIERAGSELLASHNAAALARALRTSMAALAPAPEDPIRVLLAWLYSDDFDREVTSWAAEHDRDVGDVAKEARAKMMAPSRRSSGSLGPEHWLQTLRAILEAME